MSVALAAAIGCALAVVPIWPYGYYVLLRLLVFAAAIFTLATSPDERTRYWWALGGLALVFNPVVPVHLDRLLWAPIDLAGAWFLYQTHRRVVGVEHSS